jgi:hypothetical protein
LPKGADNPAWPEVSSSWPARSNLTLAGVPFDLPAGPAILDAVLFEDGTIECDIAEAPFTGLFFRAADAQHADCVYFRPQNAVPGVKALDGSPGRDKVVQYVAWGDPKSEWQYLRKNFPGKYENYADVPLDDWFHVRLEIKGRQVQVFVNDDKEPSLTVKETLQENRKGKIGLWAWDGYFANFKCYNTKE